MLQGCTQEKDQTPPQKKNQNVKCKALKEGKHLCWVLEEVGLSEVGMMREMQSRTKEQNKETRQVCSTESYSLWLDCRAHTKEWLTQRKIWATVMRPPNITLRFWTLHWKWETSDNLHSILPKLCIYVLIMVFATFAVICLIMNLLFSTNWKLSKSAVSHA